ncbi:hypothetical protein MUK42_15263 [Musa troglodytarum]|uniref:Uncharacterized protein n=1 Tax=Musa troglodytarum TaxID=320322 RepID=A0A9E7IAA1_9LILI|nr:hypothetical protein MUK42_15263 [Musa troglodytarum]
MPLGVPTARNHGHVLAFKLYHLAVFNIYGVDITLGICLIACFTGTDISWVRQAANPSSLGFWLCHSSPPSWLTCLAYVVGCNGTIHEQELANSPLYDWELIKTRFNNGNPLPEYNNAAEDADIPSSYQTNID